MILMSESERQKELIEGRDWDCLIVLDACRYDYFEEVYEDYLDGNLRKVYSAGTRTNEWLVNTFGTEDHSDIVYVSGISRINSRGVEVVKGFNPDCFHNVVDVWDWGWDDDWNTTLPQPIRKATRMARAKYPDKRIISHFMQPHAPYLSLGGVEKNRIEKVRGFFGKTMEKLFGTHRIRKMLGKTKDFMDFKKQDLIKKVVDEGSIEVLHKAYRDDLKLVLEEVKKTLDGLPGKKVITADHGEMLGEEDLYGHSSGHPLLREIPWLEVKDLV